MTNGMVFAESAEFSAGEAVLTFGGKSHGYEVIAAAAMSKQFRAGIVHRGPDSVIVRYPCEIFAARDPHRDYSDRPDGPASHAEPLK